MNAERQGAFGNGRASRSGKESKMRKRRSLYLAVTALVAVLVVALTSCNWFSKPKGLSNLDLLIERDAAMINVYSVIAVNPNANFDNTVSREINVVGADAFINWITSGSTLELINDFGKSKYKEQLFYVEDGFVSSSASIPQATADTRVIKLSTTTSVNDSGLLEGYLVPTFEDKYGYDVQVVSAGTGAAITTAKNGNADLLLVHSKAQEEAFINAGNDYARVVDGRTDARIHFMYNYFVLIGPKGDPAGAKSAEDVKAAFALIYQSESTFISRGDNSGTHSAEVKLWPSDSGIGIADGQAVFPESYTWYKSVGQGMGACLVMANELSAYVLSDKATWLAYRFNEKS